MSEIIATTSLRLTVTIAAACIAAFPLSGCIERGLASAPLDPNVTVGPEYPLAENRKLDILFIVDNSLSMAAEQRSLAENFPKFVEVLEDIEGGLPDIHIGVISTDVGVGAANAGSCSAFGDSGTLQSQPSPSCPFSPPRDRYIEDIANVDGERIRNYPAEQTLADTFSCIAELGTGGCGYEQPLESMRRALDSSNSANDGFLREDAYLAVVFITDEDDCSAADDSLFGPELDAIDEDMKLRPSFRCWQHGVVCEPDAPLSEGSKTSCTPREDSPYMRAVADYVEFLKGLKYNEELIIVAGIMGESGPIETERNAQGYLDLKRSCGEIVGDSYSGAVPATRLDGFLSAFVHRTQTSICNADLSTALNDVADLLAEVVGNRCLPGHVRDSEPTVEGIQPTCVVSEIFQPNTSNQEEHILPVCDNSLDPESSSVQPCYVIAPSATCELSPTSLAVEVYPVERDVPIDSRLRVECLAD